MAFGVGCDATNVDADLAGLGRDELLDVPGQRVVQPHQERSSPVLDGGPPSKPPPVGAGSPESASRRAMRRSSSCSRSHSGSGSRSTVSLLAFVNATMWPGTPTTVALGGTFDTTTLPAPMRELAPSVIAPMIFAPAPTTT